MKGHIIPQESFNKVIDGRQVALINLSNAKGTVVQITNYGARIVSFFVKDSKGDMVDIVLGHADINGYIGSKERYLNAVIGRYANRISGGKFLLNGRDFKVSSNNGLHHLHGGAHGLNECVWEISSHTENKIKMHCILKDGEDGFPGELDVTVKYLLTNDNELVIDYLAKSNKDTVINLTNHAFFNLGEKHETDILKHKLMISASSYTPADEESIPTGEISPVKNTVFDFTSFKEIGADITADNAQLKSARGYDHNFVLDNYPSRDGSPAFAAAVTNPETGIRLEVFTTEPGLHFYSGNFLAGKDRGKYGVVYPARSAFCLETQHFPDSPNKLNFPSTVLKAGEEFKSSTVYKVSVDWKN